MFFDLCIGSRPAGAFLYQYSTRSHGKVNGGNALINMHVKCRHLGMAISVFKALEYKYIILWTALISGMAMNGHGIHVLQLFSSMLVNEISPDGVTFLGLLTACSHAGLVNQGLMFFNAMNKIYQIVPETQHYACLVDMYGRAGLLEEVEAFIKEMPTESDGPVWGALLNACKIHGNKEMVERSREGPCNSAQVSTGTYALLLL
ncbi:pentatricopeptide repeat-containing protein At5g66520-like [Argentina anserina]|uniref:pentatricopeptide repeat-containing protein At5g66520-like n=1 Tax=Argentina anserina TaxID=57926 RepID=UPI0021762795|nr:pentatricopeptide repeat-containing protein At5g66520-like [Potentilla anserina]